MYLHINVFAVCICFYRKWTSYKKHIYNWASVGSLPSTNMIIIDDKFHHCKNLLSNVLSERWWLCWLLFPFLSIIFLLGDKLYFFQFTNCISCQTNTKIQIRRSCNMCARHIVKISFHLMETFPSSSAVLFKGQIRPPLKLEVFLEGGNLPLQGHM